MSDQGFREVINAGKGAYYVRQDLNRVAERLYQQVLGQLAAFNNIDYQDAARARFDRLVLLLTRFCQTRIDALGAKFPYLRRIEPGQSPPPEAELQDDLALFLLAQGEVEPEKSGVASGRSDLYLPQPVRPPFRFIIEVKRLLSAWTDEAIAPFLRQTTAYQQTDLRLGVLAILDLSDRASGIPHLDACIYVAERSVDGSDRRHAVVVRIPGNKRTPSDHEEPGTPGGSSSKD